MRPHTSKNPNCFSSSSRFCKGKQARGGLLKAQELDDRVGDGKLLEVFRGGCERIGRGEETMAEIQQEESGALGS